MPKTAPDRFSTRTALAGAALLAIHTLSAAQPTPSMPAESNGPTDLLSRGWNTRMAGFGVESGNLPFQGHLWYRIPEPGDEDGNPTISDNYGLGRPVGDLQVAPSELCPNDPG